MTDAVLPNFQSTNIERLRPTRTVVVTQGERGETFRFRSGGRFHEINCFPRSCRVCSHERFDEIHELLFAGTPFQRILRAVSRDGERRLRIGDLESHVRDHLPTFHSAEVALRSAALMVGDDPHPDKITEEMFARTVIERVFQAVTRGDLELKVEQGLAAARMLREISGQAGAAENLALYARAMAILLTKTRAVLSESDFQEFVFSIQTDPEMAQIIASSDATVISRGLPPATVVDVEAESDEVLLSL